LGVVSKEPFLKKQIVPRLEKNSTALHWTQWHINLLTTDCQLSLSCARWIQAKFYHSFLYIVSLNIILQVVFHSGCSATIAVGIPILRHACKILRLSHPP
jgi:hypothetical protein